MNKHDGFYVVEYHGPQGNGSGVAVFRDGEVLGGSTGFAYAGSYEVDGDLLKARVAVTNFDPAVPSVLGTSGDFEMSIAGRLEGDTIVGTGAPVNDPTSTIAVKLMKHPRSAPAV